MEWDDIDSILDLLRQMPAHEAQIEVWRSEKIEMVDHHQFLTDNLAVLRGHVPRETHQPGMMRWFGTAGVVDIPMAWLEQQIYPYFNRMCDAYLTAGFNDARATLDAFGQLRQLCQQADSISK